MPYTATIAQEAQYLDALGYGAPEDEFRAIYNAILTHWFPAINGYLTDLAAGEEKSTESLSDPLGDFATLC